LEIVPVDGIIAAVVSIEKYDSNWEIVVNYTKKREKLNKAWPEMKLARCPYALEPSGTRR
jgi:hypothetical protein